MILYFIIKYQSQDWYNKLDHDGGFCTIIFIQYKCKVRLNSGIKHHDWNIQWFFLEEIQTWGIQRMQPTKSTSGIFASPEVFLVGLFQSE
jgi:hypothetical protein